MVAPTRAWIVAPPPLPLELHHSGAEDLALEAQLTRLLADRRELEDVLEDLRRLEWRVRLALELRRNRALTRDCPREALDG